MNEIKALQKLSFLVRCGAASWTSYVDWGIDRLKRDEEEDDLDVVMLAAATGEEEAVPLTMTIIERYLGSVTDGLVSGKILVEMFDALNTGAETAISLEPIIWRLYYDFGQAQWLFQLARNCEYATDIPAFEKPFLDEFRYITDLWRNVESEEDFKKSYNPAISRLHDVP